jgi:hypothetical protein
MDFEAILVSDFADYFGPSGSHPSMGRQSPQLYVEDRLAALS